MMKIHNYLLVSISYISLCSLAQADISAVENEFIFTQTSNTHLAHQPQLLSSFNLPQTSSEHRDFSAPISLALTDGSTASVASVCFITDAGNCGGNDFGNSPEGGSSGGSSSGGSSSSGGDACAPNDAWCLDNQKRCSLEGYNQTSCNSVSTPTNFCPYDNRFFEKCVCQPNLIDCPAGQVGVGESCGGKYASCQCDPKLVSCSSVQTGVGATCGGKYQSCTCKSNLQTCTKPYYGVGESCGGKYASCQLDNARACRESGYSQTGSCPSGQTINQKCPYDPTYFDKCVCRSDLVYCSYPLQGTGVSCGGKYQSCQCPSNYKSCSCGAAAGASSCSWGGTTKYTSCKACCSDTCYSGSKYVSCNSSQNKVRVSTTECGSACYTCQAKHSHSYSCPSGYSTSCANGYSSTTSKVCSCGATSGTCYKCKAASSSGGSSGSSWRYGRTFNGGSPYCYENSKGSFSIRCGFQMSCKSGSQTKNICVLQYGLGKNCQSDSWDTLFSSLSECQAKLNTCNCATDIGNDDNMSSCDSSGNHACSYT